MDPEAEFGGKAHRAQDTDRVFGITPRRIADQFKLARLKVADAADIIDDGKIGDIIKQRVDCKIAPPDIIINIAVNIIADDAAILAVARALVGDMMRGAKCGDLDNLGPKADMGQPETAADQTAIPKQLPDLLRPRVGHHIKILGRPAKQNIAHAAAHEIGLVTGIFQPIQHLQGIIAD